MRGLRTYTHSCPSLPLSKVVRAGAFAKGCWGRVGTSEEGFASQQVVRGVVAEGQAHQPPGAFGVLYQVGVSGPLDGIALGVLVDVGQDGVGGIAEVRPVDVFAASDGHFVPVFRAAFRDEQVVPAVFLVDVRPFGIASACACPDAFRFGQLFTRLGVDFAEEDAVAGVAHHVAFAPFKVERGVDAALFQPHRLRPLAARVGGVYQEVPFVRHVGGNHVERAFVVADGGGVDASPGAGVVQGQLRGAGEAVAYLFPVDQVLAVE